MPLAFSFSIASIASGTTTPVAIIVASVPSPNCTPLPISNFSFSYILGVANLHNLKYTGPLNLLISFIAHLVCVSSEVHITVIFGIVLINDISSNIW